MSIEGYALAIEMNARLRGLRPGQHLSELAAETVTDLQTHLLKLRVSKLLRRPDRKVRALLHYYPGRPVTEFTQRNDQIIAGCVCRYTGDATPIKRGKRRLRVRNRVVVRHHRFLHRVGSRGRQATHVKLERPVLKSRLRGGNDRPIFEEINANLRMGTIAIIPSFVAGDNRARGERVGCHHLNGISVRGCEASERESTKSQYDRGDQSEKGLPPPP